MGNVDIQISDESLAFSAPDLLRSGPVEEAVLATITESLGIDPQLILDTNWIDNGPGWVGVLLSDAQTVLGLQPDYEAMGDLCITVLGVYPEGSEEKTQGNDVEVRAFVPGIGILEDPVTGSANAGLAQWLISAGVLPGAYVARQGTVIGYDGKILLEQEGDTVWVGGAARTVISGIVEL